MLNPVLVLTIVNNPPGKEVHLQKLITRCVQAPTPILCIPQMARHGSLQTHPRRLRFKTPTARRRVKIIVITTGRPRAALRLSTLIIPSWTRFPRMPMKGFRPGLEGVADPVNLRDIRVASSLLLGRNRRVSMELLQPLRGQEQMTKGSSGKQVWASDRELP